MYKAEKEFDFVEFLMSDDPEDYITSNKFTKQELKETCASMKLDDGGTKDDLINRLIRAHGIELKKNQVIEAKSTINAKPAKGERI